MATDPALLPDHWDPRPHERTWYSHRITGDRAYMVKREGLVMVRLDRPMQEILHKLDHSWKEDHDHRPLSSAQLAQVCYAAHQKLCFVLGLPEVARKDWLSLSDRERINWLNGTGPEKPKPCRDLYQAVWGSLRELAK